MRNRHQRAQGLGYLRGFLRARGVDLLRLLDLIAENNEKIHGVEEPIGKLLRIGQASVTHHAQQIFAGMKNARHLGIGKQSAVALERMDQAEEFFDHVLIVGRLLQLHQLFGDALGALAGFG